MLPVLNVPAVTVPLLLMLAVKVVPVTVKLLSIVTLLVGTEIIPVPAAPNCKLLLVKVVVITLLVMFTSLNCAIFETVKFPVNT